MGEILAFSKCAAAEANALAIGGGAEDGYPSDSSLSATSQASDYISQPTARSARRIPRHAATNAESASAVVTSCAYYFCL